MTDRKPESWRKNLRAYFVTGLLIIIPVVATIYVLNQLFLLLDGVLGDLVNRLFAKVFGYSSSVRIPGLGLLALLLLILATGAAARNYLGRKVFEVGDNLITRVPLVNRIYMTVQQISKAFFSERREFLKRAVLIEYPRKGVYCIGFYTQDTRGEIQDKLENDIVGVFLPTTPNPTSGFLLFVPRAEVIELDMPIEEALKLVISGGAVVPYDRRQVQRLAPPHLWPKAKKRKGIVTPILPNLVRGRRPTDPASAKPEQAVKPSDAS
ncbi:MAG: DUF502 domain-containing protein [candidate division KSB1 bacterium]|nr:DUF502 domain-containing protein [candidate division KSB1 bacterium]